MRTLTYDQDLYTDEDTPRLLAKLSNKFVIQLKCVGLLEFPEKANEVWDWYADKTPLPVLNTLINASADKREAYVLLNTLDEVEDAYQHWFPMESELHDDERHLYVKMFVISPDNVYVFSNERISAP